MASKTVEPDTVDGTDEVAKTDDAVRAETAAEVPKRSRTAVRSAPAKRRRPDAAKRATADTSTAPPKSRRRAGALLVGLVALLLAATGFFGYHYFAASAGADNAETRSEIVRVANDYATKLSSFDYRDLNKNRESIAAMSTEDFGKKYDEMVKALTEIVANGKGVATAEVINSAVESVKDDKATVILFVNQKATNVVAPDGKNQPYRMVVKLQRTGGHWLVDDVQTV
ncbi:hypothetical protein GOARA_064_01580 [Gordonia araii NBRC 100433]|uniref:Mce-associated membrane protein n=1 Tax=Gordonia araii NBRC 100433 TaxID=1073574 RepID=G7H5N1_9ACTN|nr:hypothetical protein [Gordonia araii]NNG95868.1 hypothetical protein [Gordonia araii NBRC 100433]GAB11156.1 hypothetical protein GOARA_064_01580 [Gordonia araii NBRC 100433]